MRSIGLGWIEFKDQWFSSTDENTGTVAQLKAHLTTILVAEAERKRRGDIPQSCPAPLLTRKTFKALGTPTVQAESLSDERPDVTSEEIKRMAERRRMELELAGEIDWVCDRQPRSSDVPLDNSLVGVELEVRWRYRHKETGEPIYIWSHGEVVQVRANRRNVSCIVPDQQLCSLLFRWQMERRTRSPHVAARSCPRVQYALGFLRTSSSMSRRRSFGVSSTRTTSTGKSTSVGALLPKNC